MRKILILLAAGLLTAGLSSPANAQTPVGGPISTNTTWDAANNPYIVNSDVTVDVGVTLTINDGVIVKFDPARRLIVGGKLEALGSAQRIVFTSIRDDNIGGDTNNDGAASLPARRDWRGVLFATGSDPTSQLTGVDVLFAGNGNTGSVRCEGDASPIIGDCDLSFGYIGIESYGTSTPQLLNTQINAMIDVPVQISISANPVFDTVTFGSTENNGFDAIGMAGGTLTGSSTWRVRDATIGPGGTPIPNVTYILQSDITVAAGATLTIEPGIVIKPKSGVDVFVDGTLTMDGTAAAGGTIVVTSFADDTVGNPLDTNADGSTTSPAKNDWGQIEFRAGSSGSIRFADLRYGKNDRGMVRMTDVGVAAATITDVSFSNSDYGIELVGPNDADISGCNFSNTTFTPVLMSLEATPSFSGNSLSNAGIAAIGLKGGALGIDTTLVPRDFAGFTDITYWLADDLTVTNGVTFSIEPGVVTKVGRPPTGPVDTSRSIFVEGALVAGANGSDPTVFTSLRDDTYGNPADTQGNGSSSAPAPRDWKSIVFRNVSDDVTSRLENCVVAYGGKGSNSERGGVLLESAGPTIVNSEFIGNDVGIRVEGSATPTIDGCTFTANAVVPIALSLASVATFSGNVASQNEYDAVGLLAETLAIDAVIEALPASAFPAYSSGIPYVHLGRITVGVGTTLTIEPGVVAKMSNAQPIDVEGDLVMGSASGPSVIYTTIKDDSVGGDTNNDGSQTSPAAGDWSGIVFRSGSGVGSTIENVQFRFGGRDYVAEALITMLSASPVVRECEFEFIRRGLWIQGASSPVVENNSFVGFTEVPVSKSVGAAPTFSGNTFANNALDVLGLIGETIAVDATVQPWDLGGFTNITRGLVGNNLTVAFGSTLTLEPGIVLKLGKQESPGVQIDPLWGRIFVSGALVAAGTATDPVVFTSIRDDRYGNPADSNRDGSLSAPVTPDWGFIRVQDTSDDAVTLFEHCIVAYAGSRGSNFGGGLILETSGPTVRSCEFDRNEDYGIELRGDSRPTLENNSFGAHGVAPLRVSAVAAQYLDANATGNVFETTNANNVLALVDETIAADVTLPRIAMGQIENVPYYIDGTLTVGLSASMTIQPGVVVKMNISSRMIVQRSLVALGDPTAEGLIVFTSIRDDFYGGDANLDGDDTVPDANYRWGSIQIENSAIDADVQFANVVFRYGGRGGSDGALDLNSANPATLDDCIFERNRVGIRFEGASGDPTVMAIRSCDFQDNEVAAVQNVSGSYVVDATGNWWGDPTGPFDNSDDTASGGLFNPGGLGDAVTNKVDYSGFTSAGVQNLTLGDVSRNGEIRAFDASLVLQDVVGATTLDPGQIALGDVTCTSTLTAFDAGLILEYVAGLSDFFPCQFANVPTRAVVRWTGSEDGDFNVSMPDVAVAADEMQTFTIGLSGWGDLLAHTYRLRFDPNQVQVENVETTMATAGALLQWNESSPGVLDVALASGEVLDVSDGVSITVRGSSDLPSGSTATVVLEHAMLNEQVVVSQATDAPTPTRHGFVLEQNHPNPFNPSTAIQFTVPGTGSEQVPVSLAVFDLQGRRVRDLLSERLAGGEYTIVWDGRDDSARRVASGLYLYRLDAGDESDVRKMMLLK